MPKKDVENWVSRREREVDSVQRIIYLLTTHFPLDGCEETDHWSDEDRQGVDLILFPDRNFSELTDCAVIRVQVKSSETGLDGFLSKGKKIHGLDGEDWRQRRLVVLNGQWHPDTIIADFIAQLANIRGIWGNEAEMESFLSALDPYPRSCFRRAMSQGLIEAYREPLLDWVACKELVRR